jgi:aminoglycoside phosphotransferase (APT) family kinase protein
MTTGLARAILERRFPDVRLDGLRHLGSGWEFDAYLSPGGWVFRLPRRPEGARELAREPPVLDLVRPVLAPDVAVPRPELFAHPGPDFPYPVVGHRLVEGVGADHPDVPEHPALPAQLGATLGRLHAVSTDRARDAGVDVDPDGVRAWDREMREVLDELRGTSPVADAALNRLPDEEEVPADYAGPLRFIHNDLCPDHVLVRRDTGELSGLIDWTDAALADPALDFVFPVTWRGWGFTEDLLASYGPTLDGGFVPRLRHLARVLSLVWLHEALERGVDERKHLGWVENAFAR